MKNLKAFGLLFVAVLIGLTAAGSVSAGAFKDIKVVQDRVVMTGVMCGETILERKLARP